MTTRRSMLAGVGTLAATTLAGCASLRGTDDTASERIEPGDVGPVEALPVPVSTLPVAIPQSLAKAHRTRASDLLDSVPTDPSVPNGVVAKRIQADRERVQKRLTAGSDAAEQLARLEDWRHVRGDAANLSGAYRAATGTDDGAAVAERRRSVRAERNAFAATIEYRASDPVEAVLVHATLEDLLGTAERLTRATPPYPDSPAAAVEQAGDVVERVETAAASVADARGVREAYLRDRSSVTSHWATLAEAGRQVEVAADIARRPLERYRTSDVGDVFDRDVEGTLAGQLFEIAARRIRPAVDDAGDMRRDGEYARAILDSGRTLGAIAALRSVVDAIESGGLDESLSPKSVTDAATAARQATESLGTGPHPHLTVALAYPAVANYRAGRRYVEDSYFDARDAWVDFRYAALLARAAPQAADYVAARLAEQDAAAQ